MPNPQKPVERMTFTLEKQDAEFLRKSFPVNLSRGVRDIIREYRRKHEKGARK